MSYPRVFVSSTCYDLSEVRDSLVSFIKGYSFEPVLSDKGDVFYHPDLHTHDSCLHEIRKCNLFVLIIGGRFGGKYTADKGKSIVNAEYEAAKLNDIPIFCFIKREVFEDHRIYQSNKQNEEIITKINFPSIDKQEYALDIFNFIDRVRHSVVNNAFFTFEYERDIEDNLKRQWAGMFCEYLDNRKQNKELLLANKILDSLSMASKKTEEIVKNVYKYLDKENAEIAIDDIEKAVEANQFFEEVLMQFDLKKLETRDINALVNTNNKHWFEFLRDHCNFDIWYGEKCHCFNEDDGEEEILVQDILWSSNMETGLGIDGEISEYEKETYEKLSKLYNSYLCLNKDERRKIVTKYIEQIKC